MKVFYNSKLAKILTFLQDFKTIMLFGMIFTEKSALDKWELEHEKCHTLQYKDMFALGLAFALVAMFGFFAFNVVTPWLFMLLLIPLLAYYVAYYVEYVINRLKGKSPEDAYMAVSFEKHAYWYAETWDKPCEEKNDYVSFGWWL